jgi:hypothetical protein
LASDTWRRPKSSQLSIGTINHDFLEIEATKKSSESARELHQRPHFYFLKL